MAEIIVIVPTYNERENLPPLVAALLELSPGLEVLVVDDASPDGTGEVADDLARTSGRVRVLHRDQKRGLGSAYRDAFGLALETDARWICQMDADFSHDPARLRAMLEATADGNCDVAVGSRYVPGGSMRKCGWSRRFLSRAANTYARSVTGLPQRDATAGFKCFRREAIEAIDPVGTMSNGFAFQIELSHRAWQRGFSVRELPIDFVDRRTGASKMSWPIVWEALGAVWRLRRQGRPH